MTDNFDHLLPNLKEFELPNVPFKVVDPSSLPPQTLMAFDEFMRGASVPHRVYVYTQDYSRFCMLVRRGDITVQSQE
ncbi:hypothetical protein NI392_21345 [Vibrio alginolyticus]|uniref:hypothetical protein n=1 Tax=Vibrio TaxID=662 RepID=UPI000CE99B85|nr:MULTISPECIES: hypothetical protein [Vibrio]EGR2699844.1 hypothetical protein [Vibrio parahaemolyticus]MDW2295203.1 hypothetical protein [Vibrio sp. 1404]AVF75466.1 hypothetical protein AL539_17545 [Vibrio alginolyticus]AVF75492.1 hypothetical protein AL539_17700 [Vibrio alginolyticus]ELB2909228.1 hypothetical protein [Vibrio alginolyticus]